MLKCVVSPAAEQDIEAILLWTHEQFGERARLRYQSLLSQAIADLADKPERPGSDERSDIAPLVRTYHIWHSRKRVKSPAGRVQNPRHFILFRVRGSTLEIGRVLHDSMDPASHLPPD